MACIISFLWWPRVVLTVFLGGPGLPPSFALGHDCAILERRACRAIHEDPIHVRRRPSGNTTRAGDVIPSFEIETQVPGLGTKVVRRRCAQPNAVVAASAGAILPDDLGRLRLELSWTSSGSTAPSFGSPL